MKRSARVRVPASSANLGPGFDVLGLALGLYNEVEILMEESDVLIDTTGPEAGDNIPTDDHNYVVRGVELAFKAAGRKRPLCSLKVDQQIPVARGLGSSAAALVAGALAANAGMDDPLPEADLIFALVDVEGHVEQLAAALYGGLVAVAPPPEEVRTAGIPTATVPTTFTLPISTDLVIAAAVPDLRLETKAARAVLPGDVPFSDAVANIAAVTALVAGLADGDRFLLRVGMQDRLHQNYRTELAPACYDVMAAARDAGAAGACWSGAGPTILAVCVDEDSANNAAEAMVKAFGRKRIDAEPLVLDIDIDGAQILEIDGEPYEAPEEPQFDDLFDDDAGEDESIF